MNKLFGLFFLALAFLAPDLAQAATCFWVGGPGTWNASNTTSWASGTGGTPGTCAATGNIPKQATDVATFDGASGGGTVTVDSTINGVTMAGITAGAFTGTLDFSVNNPSLTLTTSLSLTGSGARKILLGSGTFTLTGAATIFDLGTTTNLDPTSVLTAPIVFSGSTAFARIFSGGGRTYGSLTIATNSSQGPVNIGGNNTFASISLAAGTTLGLSQGSTTTITNAGSLGTGSSSSPIMVTANRFDSNPSTATISFSGAVTADWVGLNGIITTGAGSFAGNNCLNFGRVTLDGGDTCAAPSGGSCPGRIIGG